MSIVLGNLDYGTVIGRFLIEVGDSDDVDLNPDIYPASGYVVFTPGTSFASVLEAEPDPATIFPQKVIGALDSEGYLHQAKFNGPTGSYATTIGGDYIPDAGVGVRLQATDDPDLNPSNWSWRAEFHFNYNGKPISYSSFNFQLPTDTTVDLAVVRPVAEIPGEYTIVGPQGPRGEIGDPGPATTLSIGSVVTKPTGSNPEVTITGESPDQTLNFGLPQGPVGPSGGPIPAGGSEGDSVMRGIDGSSEWRFTAGIQDNMFPNGSLEFKNDYRWSTSMETNTDDAPPGFDTSVWCPAGASSFSALLNDPTPIVQGDDYIMEVWVKADKPNSNLYIEMRDQDGTHAGKWYWSQGGTNPTSAYPVGQFTIPTEWVKIKSRGIIIPEATHLRVGTFYFNHTSGDEREASIGIAGLRVYRAPSATSLSESVQDVLPTADQKGMLDGVSTQDDPNSIAYRNSSGGTEFSSVTVTDTTPNTSTTLTPKTYVDSEISDATSGMATTSYVNSQVSSATSGMATESYVNSTVAGMPKAAHGSFTVDSIPGDGGYHQEDVSFPSGRFSSAPDIVATASHGGVTVAVPATSGLSTTGSWVRVWNYDPGTRTNITVRWIAIGE